MKNKDKYPIEDFDVLIEKKGEALLTFDCGDLGIRKKVDNSEDTFTAVRNTHNFFVEHNLINNDKKFNELKCVLRYLIPNKDQYIFFKKNKKYEEDISSYYKNYLRYFLLDYSKKEKTLYVQSSFLQFSEPHTLSLISTHLVSVNKIIFLGDLFECNLFPKSDEFNFKASPEYITNFLGHKKWFSPSLIIDEEVFDEGLYKNHLDDLVSARKFVNSKIKFEIFGATDKEKKCFDFAGLF